MSALHTLTLTEIRQRLQHKDVTAEALTADCLQRIAVTEPHLHALLALRGEAALEEARALDISGPNPAQALWGIPVTVKDALTTAGIPTTAGSRMLENFVPFYDAHAVECLKKAGAIILGKNNMDEFAMGSSTENSAFGPTHHPLDSSRVPGGSSGGSAASVTACQCFASLGSDTGGSIRQPAALCGCVGIKPTYGRVSRYGLIAYGSSLDQVGPLARSAEDCALVLQTIAGHDPRDSTSDPRPVEEYSRIIAGRHDLKGLRLGIPHEFFAEGLDPEVEHACQEALKCAQALGAVLVPVSLPHTAASIATYYIIAMAEASSNLARFDGVRYGHRSSHIEDLQDLYINSRTEGFGEEVQRRIILGTYVLSSGYYDAYYRKAAQVRRLIRQDYEQALNQCDVLCGPASPVTAWPLGALTTDPLQMYLMDIYTLSLNLAGLPGLSFPVGLGQRSHLPVGMQLLGRAFDESTLLSVAHVLGKAVKS
ncbi:MAG: Asp-tRNA(Asn)/Glu-tRNA(Gln) amidotransferase subunit GatA [Desulfovibrionaceae bacterium]